MILELNRLKETEKSVTGELITDGFKCCTLEPARKNPVNAGHPCISAGAYGIRITHSPHLGYDTPEVLNVLGRDNIRIHIGNFPKDSLGCILVGNLSGDDVVRMSKMAFSALLPRIKDSLDKHEEVKLFISEPFLSVRESI